MFVQRKTFQMSHEYTKITQDDFNIITEAPADSAPPEM